MKKTKSKTKTKNNKKDKPTTPNKLTASKRQKIIMKRIEEEGYMNINKRALAKELGIGKDLLYKDINKIIPKLQVPTVKETKYKLNIGLQKAYEETYKILVDNSEEAKKQKKIKLMAAKTIGDISDKKIDFLERFGIKEKIAEKQEISGRFDATPILEKFYEIKKKMEKENES